MLFREEFKAKRAELDAKVKLAISAATQVLRSEALRDFFALVLAGKGVVRNTLVVCSLFLRHSHSLTQNICFSLLFSALFGLSLAVACFLLFVNRFLHAHITFIPACTCACTRVHVYVRMFIHTCMHVYVCWCVCMVEKVCTYL